MEKRRFDELTVAIARGGSRRNVLRGLVGGVLGAVALDRSGALAKNEKEKPGKDDPITIPAKPTCNNVAEDCPLCAAARANPDCCDQKSLAKGQEHACGTQATDRFGTPLGLHCAEANEACEDNCVRATCDATTGNCRYEEVKDEPSVCPGPKVCCNVYTSQNFGTCVATRKQECR